MSMMIEQLERYNQLAMQSYRVDLKILNEKASELWEENEKHKGDILYNDKASENIKMIIKIDKLIEEEKQSLAEYIKKNLKEIEELRIQEDNYEADFLRNLRKDFSSENTARKRLYKKLGIEDDECI